MATLVMATLVRVNPVRVTLARVIPVRVTLARVIPVRMRDVVSDVARDVVVVVVLEMRM
jgi:hypothetical protein